LIVQFLSSNIADKGGTYFYRTAKDDNTEYALPSPRTWTYAGLALSNFEKDPIFTKMTETARHNYMIKMIAGNVGDSAAQVFDTWFSNFRKFEPAVNSLVRHGEKPDTQKLASNETLMIAIAACSMVYGEMKKCKSKNTSTLITYIKNVYSWINDIPEELAMGAVRISFGGDFDLIKKFELPSVPEFKNVFLKLKNKMDDWNL
jgi:hypothetical protein